MTDPTMILPPPEESATAHELHPSEVLLHLLVTLLAPMFLVSSTGDIALARAAALATLNAYRARDDVDLLSIAQIVAFGLAALGSLSLSMLDDLTLAMTLRLRGNANALNRSAEQNRRALQQARRTVEPPPKPIDLYDAGFDEVAVAASVTAAGERAAQARARLRESASAPEAHSACVPPVADMPTLADRHRQTAWAAAAARVAAEYTADFANLPPAERRAATIRAAALTNCANDLLQGKSPKRPQPNDLAMRTAALRHDPNQTANCPTANGIIS